MISNVCYLFSKFSGKIIFKICFRLKVFGINNIRNIKGSFILASNHRSFLDPPILGVVSPKKVRFVAKGDLFKYFVFGSLINLLGAIPVDINKPNISLIKKVYQLIENRESLVIFPEGIRSLPGEIKRGRLGVGYIIANTKVSVIAAYIQGSGEAWPRNKFLPKFSKINVFFSEPITIEKIYKKYPNIDNIKEKQRYRKITDFIMAEIKKLSLKAKQNNR